MNGALLGASRRVGPDSARSVALRALSTAPLKRIDPIFGDSLQRRRRVAAERLELAQRRFDATKTLKEHDFATIAQVDAAVESLVLDLPKFEKRTLGSTSKKLETTSNMADYLAKKKRLDLERAMKLKEESRLPRVYEVEVDADGRSVAVGRRKSAVASVYVTPGSGAFEVNRKPVAEYFADPRHAIDVASPLKVTGTLGLYDVAAFVQGGGSTGQAGAVRLGVARALQRQNPDFRQALKKEGLLTRDARVVERKKPGQKKARKKFQWVKR